MTINNEQVKRENYVLKIENKQLRINDNKQKEKIGQMAKEIVDLKTENQQLKVRNFCVVL